MNGEVQTATTYDAVGRLSTRQVANAGGLPSRSWYQFGSGQYSLIDELLSFTAVEPGFISKPYAFDYSTDGTRRLTHSTADNTTNSWSYDRFGNRASENTSGTGSNCPGYGEFGYAEDNRLLRRSAMPGCDNGVRYWTDQAGNRLGEADTTQSNPPGVPPIEGLRSIQTYTAANQLYFSATPTAVAGTYDFNWNWYDGSGVRVAAQAGSRNAFYPMPHPDSLAGARYYYVYDGSDISLTLTRAGTTWRVEQRLITGGVDQVIAGRFGSGASAKHLALIADRQGTTLAAAKVDGTQECSADQYSRDPFGSLQSARAAGCGGNATQTGYTGASTPNAGGGFTYLRNRWYDPQTGRFLTQDPIGLAGGVNLYAYAGNNPVTFSDPFGLCAGPLLPFCPAILAGAASVPAVQRASNSPTGQRMGQAVGAAVAAGVGYAVAKKDEISQGLDRAIKKGRDIIIQLPVIGTAIGSIIAGTADRVDASTSAIDGVAAPQIELHAPKPSGDDSTSAPTPKDKGYRIE